MRGLDVRDDGAVLLGDAHNGRIVTLNADGELIEEKRINIRALNGIAALGNGSVAVHGRSPPLGVWRDGDVSNIETEFDELSLVEFQGRLVRWREDKWIFGFGLANGWMMLSADGDVIEMYPYVEHTDFPIVVRETSAGSNTTSNTTRILTRPPSSGRSLSVVSDTLFVLFGGTRGPGYPMDEYNINTGEYIKTTILPHYANRAVKAYDGTVYTVLGASIYPTITALSTTRIE